MQKNKPEQLSTPAYTFIDEQINPTQEVYDEIELANFAEQRFITGAINNIVRQLPDPTKQSLELCEECEEQIPERRRKALPGVTKCVSCQQAAEDAKKRQTILQGYVYRNE